MLFKYFVIFLLQRNCHPVKISLVLHQNHKYWYQNHCNNALILPLDKKLVLYLVPTSLESSSYVTILKKQHRVFQKHVSIESSVIFSLF